MLQKTKKQVLHKLPNVYSLLFHTSCCENYTSFGGYINLSVCGNPTRFRSLAILNCEFKYSHLTSAMCIQYSLTSVPGDYEQGRYKAGTIIQGLTSGNQVRCNE